MRLLSGNGDVDVNARDIYGGKPLHMAIRYGRRVMVGFLMKESHINANIMNRRDGAPLGLGIVKWSGRQEARKAAKWVIARDDAKINVGFRLMSPLSLTSSSNNETAMTLLLQRHDLKLNKVNGRGETALAEAAHHGYEAIVTLLLRRADIGADIADIKGRTALIYAAWSGSDFIVRQLLGRKDVDAKRQDKIGYSALMYASGVSEGVVKILLNHTGVFINQADIKERTALYHTIFQHRADIAPVLLGSHDIHINHRDHRKQTPLVLAARQSKVEVVTLLLQKRGVQKDCRDQDNRTAPMAAYVGGREDIVEVLEQAGVPGEIPEPEERRYTKRLSDTSDNDSKHSLSREANQFG